MFSRFRYKIPARESSVVGVACILIAISVRVYATQYDLVYVPPGEFTMGLTITQESFLLERGWPMSYFEDEKPSHKLNLSGFSIGKNKVTNSQYLAFLKAQGVDPEVGEEPWINPLYGRTDLPVIQDGKGSYMLSSADQADYPMSQATWFGAQAFCQYYGLQLPTEAEWEKAARGADARTYPWGEGIDRTRANYGTDMSLNLILYRQISPDDWIDVHETDWLDASDGFLYLSPVGAFPNGSSPYGANDMAGNLFEWVADWYAPDYYSRSQYNDPPGPEAGQWRVLRGCAYDCGSDELRASNREWSPPNRAYLPTSFRCVCGADCRSGSIVNESSWGFIKQRGSR